MNPKIKIAAGSIVGIILVGLSAVLFVNVLSNSDIPPSLTDISSTTEMSEDEYNKLVDKAQKTRNPDLCKQAKSYVRHVGFEGTSYTMSEKRAEDDCINRYVREISSVKDTSICNQVSKEYVNGYMRCVYEVVKNSTKFTEEICQKLADASKRFSEPASHNKLVASCAKAVAKRNGNKSVCHKYTKEGSWNRKRCVGFAEDIPLEKQLATSSPKRFELMTKKSGDFYRKVVAKPTMIKFSFWDERPNKKFELSVDQYIALMRYIESGVMQLEPIDAEKIQRVNDSRVEKEDGERRTKMDYITDRTERDFYHSLYVDSFDTNNKFRVGCLGVKGNAMADGTCPESMNELLRNLKTLQLSSTDNPSLEWFDSEGDQVSKGEAEKDISVKPFSYHDDVLNFSFSYPTDWELSAKRFNENGKSVCVTPSLDSGGCTINIIVNDSMDFRDWYNKIKSDYSDFSVKEVSRPVANTTGRLLKISDFTKWQDDSRDIIFASNGLNFSIAAASGYESQFRMIVDSFSAYSDRVNR